VSRVGRGAVLLMRFAPLIGRADGRRIVSVLKRVPTVAEALWYAAKFDPAHRPLMWVARAQVPAHRRRP
jgi:hypothetical protein